MTYDPATMYVEAHASGEAAARAATPELMVVEGYGRTYYVPDGSCGFASIKGIRKNSRLGKWMVENGKVDADSVSPGVYRWVHDYGQSKERKAAYAYAFAAVLVKYGVKCHVTVLDD